MSLRQPDQIEDTLTAILRSGARRLLAHTIEADVGAVLGGAGCRSGTMAVIARCGTDIPERSILCSACPARPHGRVEPSIRRYAAGVDKFPTTH